MKVESTKTEIKNVNPNIANAVLGDVLQVGNFVEFNGMSMKIYGCICRVNSDNTVDYVRESLTRWAVDIPMIQKGSVITEDNFISRVKLNAENSGAKIPSTEEVKTVLEIFKSNFDVDSGDIRKALNIT
jgi:hypothetical protein